MKNTTSQSITSGIERLVTLIQKKQKKTWNFDEAFRQQFWAEAKEIWKSGEKLYLEGVMCLKKLRRPSVALWRPMSVSA